MNGDRVVAVYEMYLASKEKLSVIKGDNELFAHYSLTKFLLLFLVRSALETDDTGMALTQRPSDFLSQPKGMERLRSTIAKLSQTLVRLLDGEIFAPK